jgi:hypothetical protein
MLIEPVAIDPRSNVIANSMRAMWNDQEGKSKTFSEDQILFRLYLHETNKSLTPISDRVTMSQTFPS